MRTVIRNNYTPAIGDYCNTLVIDDVSQRKWLFDQDGVFTDMTPGGAGVTSELGQSTELATSQKLVTDNIERIDDDISALRGDVDNIQDLGEVMSDLEVGTVEATSFSLDREFVDLGTGATRTAGLSIPIATDVASGIMPAGSMVQIENNTQRIAALETGEPMNFVVSFPSDTPTQAEIQSLYETASGKTGEALEGTRLVDTTRNMSAQWFSSADAWVVTTGGTGMPPIATQTSVGVVKGSTSDGQIYVEADGSMSLNGYDWLYTQVSNIPSLYNTIGTNTDGAMTQDATTSMVYAPAGQFQYPAVINRGIFVPGPAVGSHPITAPSGAIVIGGGHGSATQTYTMAYRDSNTVIGTVMTADSNSNQTLPAGVIGIAPGNTSAGMVFINSGYGIGIGNNATISANSNGAIALGQNALVMNSAGGVAIGNGATVNGNNYSVAIGQSSAVTRQYEFAVGSASNTRYVSNVTDPTLPQDAATKSYVDSQIGNVPSGSLVVTGTYAAGTITIDDTRIPDTLYNGFEMTILASPSNGSATVNYLMVNGTQYGFFLSRMDQLDKSNTRMNKVFAANFPINVRFSTITSSGQSNFFYTVDLGNGPLNLDQGGTGATSFTARSPMIAGITASSALRSMTSPTVPSVLSQDSSAADPYWTAKNRLVMTESGTDPGTGIEYTSITMAVAVNTDTDAQLLSAAHPDWLVISTE